jgi:hypothetical protein
VFDYWTFVWFIDFYGSWQGQGLYIVITRCEKIIEHTGTPVNIIYYIVALLQYEYTSKESVQNGNENNTDGAVDFVCLSFFMRIMVVLNYKYVDMLNL